ncbi:MAG: TlpA family protein disulfide reductase [Planctomycetales bacterium]|nr:TlpA family protein disulfide reductase [bacterium]UNM09447.1 MAG: TlpA family protein disulfide reductase [Planctomycetales bacterium]
MKAIQLIILSLAAILLLAVSCNKTAEEQAGNAKTLAQDQEGQAYVTENKLEQDAAASKENAAGEQANPGGGSESDGASSARSMPEFSVRRADGEVLGISSFYGRPLVVNFWGDWCPPCVDELPALNEVYKERKAEFDMIAVSVDSKAAEDFWKEKGFEIPMYHSVDVKEKLGLSAFPSTFFLDRDGKVVGYVTTEMTREDFEMRLATILR